MNIKYLWIHGFRFSKQSHHYNTRPTPSLVSEKNICTAVVFTLMYSYYLVIPLFNVYIIY